MSLFSDLFGDPGAGFSDAAKTRAGALATAASIAVPYMEQGLGNINTGYTQAQDVFKPIVSQTGAGAGLYADLTGANGPEGQERARALFQTDPGYQFALDQALQATQRAQGTGGYQGSGNVLTALQDRAAGLASQQYGNWAARLAPFVGQNIAAGGVLGGLYTGQGTDTASELNALANLQYGTASGIGSAIASGQVAGQQAQNQMTGQFLGLGAKLLGYALGGPAGGALGSIFGGGGGSVGNTSSYPSNIDQMIAQNTYYPT